MTGVSERGQQRGNLKDDGYRLKGELILTFQANDKTIEIAQN
ncbi:MULTISPECIES: hypothetical protein [Photorhabdus]|nr:MULTISPECIES: hypothetical protein [Photorhabdus]MDB6368675.1 hypothetical protein [Photorhabdus bodei]